MGTPLVALALFLGLLLLLALFAKGGPTETFVATALPEELSGIAQLELAELGSVSKRLFSELGFATVTENLQPDRFDLTLEDPTPVTGQKMYLRCVLPPKEGTVQSAEVQAALDTARGENLSKAVVVTAGLFSDEAKLVAQRVTLELIDGQQLAGLLRTHLPDVANRLRLPR